MSLRGHGTRLVAQVPIERFLIVGIGPHHFALSADLVHGLMTMEEIGSTGGLTVQGQDYLALDLEDRLGLAPVGNGPETRMVLLAQAGIRARMLVDQVHGLVEVERTRILPLPGQFRNEERSWYRGLLLYGEGVAVGLHSGWLLEGAMQRSNRLLNQNQPLPFCLSDTSDSMRKDIVC